MYLEARISNEPGLKSSDAKASSAIWNFLLKWAFLSGSYVYVQLFHINGNKKNLFIAIKVKLLNLHTGA